MTAPMKNKILFILFACSLSVVLFFTGCKKSERYGQAVSDGNPVDIEKILMAPQDFDGKTVKLEGKIIRECPTGCWFDLRQGQGQIHVDLNPNGFAIPQVTGKSVVVEGQVKYEEQNVSVIGKGVEIK